jgi:crotonobetainyl-CoA:carnitine CoA-transferase CaiB-like acyl-CoA transferase
MPPEKQLVPEPFGPLRGVRILSTGAIIAQPFAAALAAQMGAEVIQVERPGTGDAVWREMGLRLPAKDGTSPPVSASWLAERRNQRHVSLDLSRPAAREIFLRHAAWADVWMESSRPGTYARWGLGDDVVHARNPRLVICHVSGYGQSGDPAYTGRASYDMIGQAFGGLMFQTGFPDPAPPVRANPWTGDYLTALFCLSSSLAGYIHARATGEGQSIDLAQFEAVHAVLAGTMVEWFQLGQVRQRSGNRATAFQPYDVFHAADGWVVIAAVGSLFDKVCRLLGLDPGEERWARARLELDAPHGREFDALLRRWVAERTMAEVVERMNEAGVAACPIVDAETAAEDRHYRARGVHVEWEDEQVGTLKGVGPLPKFSATPLRIWRGSVPVGADNRLVYGELLGLSDAELERLAADGTI